MEDFLSNKKLIHALKMISPGSPLRQGLDNILKAKTGGLIVLASSEEIMEVVDGGFCINAEYSPAGGSNQNADGLLSVYSFFSQSFKSF